MTKEMERFRGGSWDSAYTYLGAHPAAQGYTFRVWAPHARHVALAGDFNPEDFTDSYREALETLVMSKAEGVPLAEEPEAPPEVELPPAEPEQGLVFETPPPSAGRR